MKRVPGNRALLFVEWKHYWHRHCGLTRVDAIDRTVGKAAKGRVERQNELLHRIQKIIQILIRIQFEFFS